MYKLYLLDIQELNDDNVFALLFNQLKKRQREKIQKYSSRKKQNIILSEFLFYNYFFPNKKIYYNEYGKPYFKNIYFNISHTDNYILLGIADEDIGVDIQKITFKKNVEKLFSDKEKKVLESAKDKAKIFTRYWSLKESYVKYLGTGISKEIFQEPIEEKNVNFYEYYDLDRYIIVVCLKNKCQKQELNYLALNSFIRKR